MRFRSSYSEPSLRRSQNRRLVMLVGALGCVIIAIQFAARESSWYWLTGTSPDAGSGPDAASRIDFRVNADDEDGQPGIRVGSSQQQTTNSHRDDQPASASEAPAFENRVVSPDVLVSADAVAQIRDNSVGIRDSERNLYYRLLAKSRDVSAEALHDAAQDDVAYAVLMTESQRFLGHVLTIQGEIRRLSAYPTGPNDAGIDRLYEAWLFNADSGLNPYRILCTSIPDGIPIGLDLKSGTIVTVTGYYFKRFGYPTSDGRLHVAPLILAKTLIWHRPATVAAAGDSVIIPYLLLGIAVLGTAIGFALWRLHLGDRRFEDKYLKRLTVAPRESIAALNEIPVVDVGESLRQLGEAHASRDAAAAPPPGTESTAPPTA